MEVRSVFAIPPPIRDAFAVELRLANDELRRAAREIRLFEAPDRRIERAIDAAWSHLAHVERVVGLSGGVSIASATERFLIVDDSEDARFLLGRALRMVAPTARIQDACDGDEALELLKDATDGAGLMVISDHDMGLGVTGVELLAEIAKRHPRAHRILLTGHALEQFAQMDVQAHALISKDERNGLRRYLGAP